MVAITINCLLFTRAESIIKKTFPSSSYSEKLEIITAGKPKPKLNLPQIIKPRKKKPSIQ